MQKRDSHVYPSHQIRWIQLNVWMIINFDSLIQNFLDQFHFSF